MTMHKTLLRMSLVAVLIAAPIAAFGSDKPGRYISAGQEAADFKGDAKGLKAFSLHESKSGLVKVQGDITAVSATSITVLGEAKTSRSTNTNASVKVYSDSEEDDAADVSYTFTINSDTKVLRRFRGTSSVSELSVGDEVKVWVDKLEAGTAKMILDKSIWWLRLGGRAVEVDDTNKTFRLLMPFRKHGRLKTFSGVIKTSALTQYIKADGTAGTFTDIDNNDKLRVRGVWNNEGFHLNARKVWLIE
jgi:hypothetical protein